MRDIIRRHNRLNGVIFSLVEFGLIMLGLCAFGIYSLIYRKTILASIALGMAINCLPVVFYGIQMLRIRARTGEGRASYWNRSARVQLGRENPHMLRDTLVLTFVTLIPCAGFLGVCYDEFKSHGTR